MKHLFILLIKLYQLCMRPFLGECCRFYPSCSEYAIEAYAKKGVIVGTWLTAVRLIKCGPWHPGGVDQVSRRDNKFSS